ncbi:sigma-54-dependent Fis family transcriptional regulator [Burkholderia multivorans]|uniref:sigma-54-dependent Fis family transcriptional regulator n=1 Tax=Burkholderia multivorans TaxID=87883 RepID=UPI000CFEBB37|nr:sigma-54-dependent Fis family transcriptional regulator [Burkholderia multivorans]PRF37953.1 sigma-54-dependent Fis family transcriptional regulator [Burkholderia multivorans]
MRDDVHPATDTRAAQAPGWPTPTIRKSHQRSETFGLQASARPDYDVLSATELALKREQNRVLCVHAMPVMETLHEQIVNTQSMIVLTDAEGLILHSIGDDDFLRRAERVALRPGANWAEDRQGTNAIGTALAELCPMVVHGDQHFLAANHFLTCSSVPILDPYGDVIGVLDVTGDHRSYHQHTMALAKMSVQMIENHLFTTTFQETLQVSFHGRPEFLGTLMEGIVAFTADGRFLSANRSAQFQLGMPLSALRAHTLASLFDVTSAQLIDRMRASTEPHVMLNLGNGAVVCARVQFRRALRAEGSRPADVHDGGAVPAARPAAAHGAASLSRLSYLDTGDPQVAAVIAKVRKVIGKDIPVLITGETGTGKELLAQAIHNDSPRRDGPFVAVNCASIPETLIESELFGYEEGAFTGARRKGATGKLLQANGGTLFLDEIGDMPVDMQVKLLRVLQDGHFERIGGDRARHSDFRLISASNRDFKAMIANASFRLDLFYRISAVTLRLPALRERLDDIPELADTFLEAFAIRHGAPKKAIADSAIQFLQSREWPGNIRQLQHAVERAAIFCDGPVLSIADFGSLEGAIPARLAEPVGEALAVPNKGAVDMREAKERVESELIRDAMRRTGGNKKRVAEELGISRSYLYKRLSAMDDPQSDKPLSP